MFSDNQRRVCDERRGRVPRRGRPRLIPRLPTAVSALNFTLARLREPHLYFRRIRESKCVFFQNNDKHQN